MRRALLTAQSPVAAPITLGTIPPGDISSTSTRAFYTRLNPAGGTGTLTTGSVKLSSAASIYFFTVNATTLTVRAVSVNVSAAAGLGTYPISLPVVTGDYIGVAGASGSISVRRDSGGTGFYTRTSAPVVGDDVSAYSFTSSGTLWLQAST